MDLYNFIFNTRTGLAILIFGGMALFALIAALLERGTRAKYRDRPAPPEDDDDDYEDDEGSEYESSSGKSREERFNEGLDRFQEKVNEGGLIGAMGISVDDDDEDEDEDENDEADEEGDRDD